ncbi:MAG: hypothetical protein ABIA67_03830, partial [Candidatus Margulisiibacteriota bacterium]
MTGTAIILRPKYHIHRYPLRKVGARFKCALLEGYIKNKASNAVISSPLQSAISFLLQSIKEGAFRLHFKPESIDKLFEKE